MKSYYKTIPKKPKKDTLGPISRQMKICVACGNTRVVEYKHGISCARCGTCFYYGRNEL